MPIRPEDFLDAAKNLNDRRPIAEDEARFRTIVGRVYYSAYLKTRAAGRKGLQNPDFDPTSHKEFAQGLKGAGDPQVSAVGERLDRLRILRSKADYYPSKTVTKLEAQLAIKHAQRIFDSFHTVTRNFPPIPSR